MALTIFCNTRVTPEAEEMLRAGTAGHRLIIPESATASVLAKGVSEIGLLEADVAFGQPDPHDCIRSPRLKWVEVSSAGYTRYDTPEFFGWMRSKTGVFTNVSSVFADPCAQHVLAMMLALGRQLLPSFRDQMTDQSWHYDERRYHSRLLTGQTVLMLGYGAIGRRLSPNSEVGGKKAGQIEQHMRGSDGADSNFGEVGIFHTKIRSMSGICFLSPPQASESKSTGFRAARPNTAPPRNTAARNVAGCR